MPSFKSAGSVAEHHQILALAVPIIVSNISVPLVGIVDTAVIGHLGHAHYIGAIALGALIFSFLYWGFGFLKMGTTGLTAQALGAADSTEIRAIAIRAAIVAVAIGLGILLVREFVLAFALDILRASDNVESLTAEYFRIRSITAPVVMINYIVLGILIGLQNTRSVLIIQLVLNLTNVVLDIIFVYYLKLEVAGVAWATVISEVLAVTIGAWLICRELRQYPAMVRWSHIMQRDRIRKLFTVNINLFIRNICIIFTHSWFTAQGARFGDNTLAANAVLMHFIHLMAYALDGFAHAAEALVGKAMGKASVVDYSRVIRLTSIWAGAGALFASAVYLALGDTIISLMTTVPEVQSLARTNLPWVIVAPLIVVWAYQLDGIFTGATHTLEMRNAMIISMLAFAAASFVLVPRMNNQGLWLSLILFMAVRGISLGLYLPRIGRDISRQFQQKTPDASRKQD